MQSTRILVSESMVFGEGIITLSGITSYIYACIYALYIILGKYNVKVTDSLCLSQSSLVVTNPSSLTLYFTSILPFPR